MAGDNGQIVESVVILKRGDQALVQWLAVCLPVQGTWAGSLVGEESILNKATEPMSHSSEAHTP